MAGEHLEKTAAAPLAGARSSADCSIAGQSQGQGQGQGQERGSLTTPQAEEVLWVARLNRVHGAVLDTHNGQFGAQRHRGWAAVVCGGRR